MTAKIIHDSSYVHPEVLVDTQWLEDPLGEQKLRITEVDHDLFGEL
jgi:hypothetical protein